MMVFMSVLMPLLGRRGGVGQHLLHFSSVLLQRYSRPDLESRPPQAPPGHPTATPAAAVRRIRSYAARDRVLGAEEGCKVA